MVGEPRRFESRVPGYEAGYSQAPGQMRPSLAPEPFPIGRPSLVVGGPAYYTPPSFSPPPQPTQAFMPTDVRPDPIGQQFMRQMESPMGQQFQRQYEATQAPIRQAERERQEAELARRDERFQELMDRISELEGQLSREQEAPVMPSVPSFGDSGFQIDFSKIPNFVNNMKNITGIGDVQIPDEIDLDEILERQREQRMDRPMGIMPMPTIPMPTTLRINNLPSSPSLLERVSAKLQPPLRRMNVMGSRGIENLRSPLMK